MTKILPLLADHGLRFWIALAGPRVAAVQHKYIGDEPTHMSDEWLMQINLKTLA